MTNWRKISLGECGKWFSGGTPSRGNPEYWNGDIPWVSGKSLHNYYVNDAEEYVTASGAENGTRKVPSGTILLLVRGMMLHKRLPVGLSTREVTFNQDVKALIPYEILDPQFLLYWFVTNSPRILNLVEESSHGTGRIPTDALYRTTLKFPPLAEQRKIAQILSTWDEAIALVESLISALKLRKQGLMQRLLTGEVRFAGFDDAWQEVRLGDVFQISAGGDFDKENSSNVPDDTYLYPIYSNSVTNKGLYGYSSYYRHDENSITVTARGTLGHANFRDHKFTAVGRLLVLKQIVESNGVFFANYINDQIRFIYETTGVPQLTAPSISSYKAVFPELEEQNSIAEVLELADDQIDLYVGLIDHLREQKKGLMQGLLTGSVRVGVGE